MTMTPGEAYEIRYVADGVERTARAHYRGLGSGDEMARAEESVTDPDVEMHWFKVDGQQGYLVVAPNDLIAFEPAN